MSNHLYDHLIAPQAENQSCFLQLNRGGPDERSMSFREFTRSAAQIAHALVSNGVKPGDRVIAQAPKRWEMLALYIATVQIGAVFLPLNTAYTLDELRYFIADAEPRTIVCQGSVAESLNDTARDASAVFLTLNADGSGSLSTEMSKHPGTFETVHRDPGDLAALLYTSGTTGRSKGAMLTHDNLLSNAATLADHWAITSADTLIHALPIFHSHGLFVAINTCLLAGAKVNFLPEFDPDAIVASLPRATLMMGVPTFYTRLLADARVDRDLTGNMRLIISGSAPLRTETHKAFLARTGHRILERYGMTETNMITSTPYGGERRAGTVGFPLDGVEIRLTDAEGNDVSPGEVGMIEVRGPNVFEGYWNMPEKTAEGIRDNGFFITGDLGQLDDDGFLMIVGREKDLIISGGYNVYPKEIEDVLNSVEGIEETAVYGVPHSDLGEQIVAAVVPAQGTQMEPDRLAKFIDTKLARFKQPREYIVLEKLPRNTMGKVQKNVLRDRYSKPQPT